MDYDAHPVGARIILHLSTSLSSPYPFLLSIPAFVSLQSTIKRTTYIPKQRKNGLPDYERTRADCERAQADIGSELAGIEPALPGSGPAMPGSGPDRMAGGSSETAPGPAHSKTSPTPPGVQEKNQWRSRCSHCRPLKASAIGRYTGRVERWGRYRIPPWPMALL